MSTFGRRLGKAEAAIAPKARCFVFRAGVDVPAEELEAFRRDVLGVLPTDLVIQIREFDDPVSPPRLM